MSARVRTEAFARAAESSGNFSMADHHWKDGFFIDIEKDKGEWVREMLAENFFSMGERVVRDEAMEILYEDSWRKANEIRDYLVKQNVPDKLFGEPMMFFWVSLRFCPRNAGVMGSLTVFTSPIDEDGDQVILPSTLVLTKDEPIEVPVFFDGEISLPPPS